jgi:protein phosphatase
MDAPHLDIAARSHKGLVRRVNQDAFAVHADHGLVVLADGMGGHSAGEVASQLAVQTISNVLVTALQGPETDAWVAPDWLRETIGAANEALLLAVEEHPELAGMGTTVVLGLFLGDRLLYAHVGDSRIYRLRGSRLEALTRDHSVIQSMVDKGVFNTLEDAQRAGMPNNLLTRGVGAALDINVDVDQARLEPGDTFLFCSDGLTNMVNDRDMESIIHDAQGDLEAAADWLLELALANGGSDNVSLVLARPNPAGVCP